MSEGNTNRHSINCKILRGVDDDRLKAWLIDDGAQEVWFPKSQGEIYPREDGTHDLFGEEWILKKKGLI